MSAMVGIGFKDRGERGQERYAWRWLIGKNPNSVHLMALPKMSTAFFKISRFRLGLLQLPFQPGVLRRKVGRDGPCACVMGRRAGSVPDLPNCLIQRRSCVSWRPSSARHP